MLKKIAAWVADRAISVGAIVIAIAALSYPIRAQLNAPQTWAGTAGGTTSAIAINIHNVSSLGDVTAVPLRFIPSGANPGAATLTINIDGGGTLGPIAIQKQTQTSGALTALVGNEFQSGQIATVMYDGTEFQCLTCTPVTPAGSEADFSGVNIPAGWLLENGSAQSRTAQAVLFNALNFTSVSAVTVNSSNSVAVSNSALYQIGWYVGGPNVPCNVQISSIPDGTHIALSSNATNGGSTTLTIGPNPQGDCATTFNIPNRTGVLVAMVDGSTNITSAGCSPVGGIGSAATLGARCGTQTNTLVAGNVPQVSATVSATFNNVPSTAGVWNNQTSVNIAGSSGDFPQATTAVANMSSLTSTGTAGNASPTAFTNLPPIAFVYKIIKT